MWPYVAGVLVMIFGKAILGFLKEFWGGVSNAQKKKIIDLVIDVILQALGRFFDSFKGGM